jgi:hypothetical protein
VIGQIFVDAYQIGGREEKRSPGSRSACHDTEELMAEFEKRLACVIAADGSVVRGYLIGGCEFDGVNAYTLTWKVPLQEEAKTNFAGTIGSAMSEPVRPGLITVGLGDARDQMVVHTFDPDGTPAARSFHLVCFRDQ